MSMRQSRDELIKRGVLKEIFEKGELMTHGYILNRMELETVWALNRNCEKRGGEGRGQMWCTELEGLQSFISSLISSL